jgi:hypothetical protein
MSSVSQPLYLWPKSARYLSNRILQGFHNTSGCFGEELKLLPLPGKEPRFLGRPNPNLIAVSAVIFRLAFYICHIAVLNTVYQFCNTFFPKTFATTGKIILNELTSISKVIADATKYPTLIYDRRGVFFLNP